VFCLIIINSRDIEKSSMCDSRNVPLIGKGNCGRADVAHTHPRQSAHWVPNATCLAMLVVGPEVAHVRTIKFV
jgi:hypothetical protein